MLAVTFWSVGGVSDAALVAAALSLSTCEVVRPGVLCCFGAAALTLPRFALERLAGPSQLPLALLELIAASFHRSFIVCLGWPRLSDDGLAPAAVYANALLAGCWWAAGGDAPRCSPSPASRSRRRAWRRSRTRSATARAAG